MVKEMKITLIKTSKLIITGIAVIGLGVAVLSSGWSRASAAPVAGGADTYKTKCAACHGADGSGNTPAGKNFHLRDLGSADVQGQSDAQLLSIISNGKNKMPGFQKTLGADTCSELVKFVRSLKH